MRFPSSLKLPATLLFLGFTPVQASEEPGKASPAGNGQPVATSPSDPTTSTLGPKEGSLVIVGGGQLSLPIVERFARLAGGTEAEVVLIPTAAEDDMLDREALARQITNAFGFKKVAILHTRDCAEADSEAFVAPLKTARAVWFGGGRHWRLVDSYLGTRTQREVEKVLERGGVVGGSSAGATIIGSFLV